MHSNYFINRIRLSISGKCSCSAVVFRATPVIRSLSHSNYLSIRIVLMSA